MQNEEMQNKNRNQKGKSLLIFSAVTALFIGIMGYEVIRENRIKEIPNPEVTRKLPILSNYSKNSYQKSDRVELALLNAQNHYFSNKIISLKEEVHENSKKLQTLRLSIITAGKAKENEEIKNLKKLLEHNQDALGELQKNYERNQEAIAFKEIQIAEMEKYKELHNQDKDIISELQNSFNSHAEIVALKDEQLLEMDRLKEQIEQDKNKVAELKGHFDSTLQEIAIKEKQIDEMEVAIEILTGIVDKEKTQKLESHAKFQQNVDQIIADATAEKSRLATLIHELEAKENDLKNQAQEQLTLSLKLEDELERSHLLALDKELEVDMLADDFKLKQNTLVCVSENLSYLLETEKLASDHIQKELHYTETELAAKVEKIKLIEDEQIAAEAIQKELHYTESELAIQMEKLKQVQEELRLAFLATEEKNQIIHSMTLEIAQKDEALQNAKLESVAFETESNERFAKLQELLVEKDAKSVQDTILALHDFSLHEEVTNSLANDLQKKQTELDQLKSIHNALSHDRNALSNLIDEKNLKVEELENKALEVAENHESLNLFLQENINALTENLESELNKIKELEGRIEAFITLQDLEKNNSLELQEQIVRLNSSLIEAKEMISLKEETQNELNKILKDYEKQLMFVELGDTEKKLLNDQLADDLELAQKLLAEKTALFETENQNALAYQKELESLHKKLSEDFLASQNLIADKNALFDLEKNNALAEQEKLQAQILKLSQTLAETHEIMALKENTHEELKSILKDHENLLASIEISDTEKKMEIEKLTEDFDRAQMLLAEKTALFETENQNALAYQKELESNHQKLTEDILAFQTLLADKTALFDLEKNNALAEQEKLHAQIIELNLALAQTQEMMALKENTHEELKAILKDHEDLLANIEISDTEKKMLNEKLMEDFEHAQMLLAEKTAFFDAAKNDSIALAEDLQKQIHELNQALDDAKNMIALKEHSYDELTSILKDHEEKLANANLSETEKNAINNQLKNDLEEHQILLAEKTTDLEKEKNNVLDLEEQLTALNLALADAKELITSKEMVEDELKMLLKDHEKKVVNIEFRDTEKKMLNEQLKEDLEDAQSYLAIKTAAFENQLEDLNQMLKSSKEMLALKEDAQNTLAASLKEREEQLANSMSNHLENTVLSQKLAEDLEVYQAFFDAEKASFEISKNNAIAMQEQLESQINELSSALKDSKDLIALKEQSHNELSELLAHHEEKLSNMELSYQSLLSEKENNAFALEKQLEELTNLFNETKEMIVQKEQSFEEAKMHAAVNEINLTELKELLVAKEQEVETIQEKHLETAKDNEKLFAKIQKQHISKQQLYDLIDFLVKREEELTRALNSQGSEPLDAEPIGIAPQE